MSKIGDWLFLIYGRVKSLVLWPDYGKNLPVFWVFMGKILEVLVFNSWFLVLISWVLVVFSSWVFMIFRKNVETTSLTESAIVWISKSLNQQMSFQSQQMAGVAKISKCLSQQMSRPSQQMSNQQMSVSKCPVSKWKIGACPDTKNRLLRDSDGMSDILSQIQIDRSASSGGRVMSNVIQTIQTVDPRTMHIH